MRSLLQLAVLLSATLTATGIEDKQHWRKVAKEELKESLAYKWNTGKAKNVVFFVGDGMSIDTVTATRIYRAGETSHLSWERFPHVGLLKTYNTDKQVPDSASTATALFGGVKTNYEVVGLDVNVKQGDCKASLNTDYHVDSIISWAQAAGKATGFVTTTRVTHATPAPLYAHSAHRRWECEAKMPQNASACKDIARQLVENEPGKNIKVIMGGGRQVMKSNVKPGKNDPIDTWACYSKDNRDLIKDWIKDKRSRKVSFDVVENNEQLSKVDTKNVDYLLGIFANGHIKMDWERDRGPQGQPSLEEMTVAAVKILKKSPEGFLLVVEGGLIDYAHHRGHAAQALLETVRFSEAIDATLKLINTAETLIIVTSDHSHSMNFNGYPKRGASMLGIGDVSKWDKIPFTTLTYSTGGPNNVAFGISNDTKPKLFRIDPSTEDTEAFTYSQQSLIVSDEVHHGGGDVAIYAIGPSAHLFHSLHEQNYVAQVISYAADLDRYRNSSEYRGQTITNIFFYSCILLLMLASFR